MTDKEFDLDLAARDVINACVEAGNTRALLQYSENFPVKPSEDDCVDMILSCAQKGNGENMELMAQSIKTSTALDALVLRIASFLHTEQDCGKKEFYLRWVENFARRGASQPALEKLLGLLIEAQFMPLHIFVCLDDLLDRNYTQEELDDIADIWAHGEIGFAQVKKIIARISPDKQDEVVKSAAMVGYPYILGGALKILGRQAKPEELKMLAAGIRKRAEEGKEREKEEEEKEKGQ